MNTKRYIYLFSLVLIGIFSSSFLRSEGIDFTIKVNNVSMNTMDVEITVISGEPEFIYSLWENEPWENGREIENSGTTGSFSYTFSNLSKKPYFVMVSGKDGLKRVKQIKLQTDDEYEIGQAGN
jgi:hypothetical protein